MTTKLFISYCHDDEYLKDEFIKSLAVYLRKNQIEIWHDRLIEPGMNFDDEISKKIEKSDIMVLLISSSFIASDYCYETEFKKSTDLTYSRKARHNTSDRKNN